MCTITFWIKSSPKRRYFSLFTVQKNVSIRLIKNGEIPSKKNGRFFILEPGLTTDTQKKIQDETIFTVSHSCVTLLKKILLRVLYVMIHTVAVCVIRYKTVNINVLFNKCTLSVNTCFTLW